MGRTLSANQDLHYASYSITTCLP
uniref:Uncharacterized protein n=1 Tax=Arundo donax TaxID=35708 RepID=A0A0A8ZET9_ARUDO